MWAVEMFHKEDEEGVTLRHENNNAMSFINPNPNPKCEVGRHPRAKTRLESAKENVLTPLQKFDWVKHVGKWREGVAGQPSERMASRCAR
jgi:hypothetical protein